MNKQSYKQVNKSIGLFIYYFVCMWDEDSKVIAFSTLRHRMYNVMWWWNIVTRDDDMSHSIGVCCSCRCFNAKNGRLNVKENVVLFMMLRVCCYRSKWKLIIFMLFLVSHHHRHHTRWWDKSLYSLFHLSELSQWAVVLYTLYVYIHWFYTLYSLYYTA